MLIPEKLLQIQYTGGCPCCGSFAEHGAQYVKKQPQYEDMHTREQSVPSLCSRCGPPPPSHTVHCSCQMTQETQHLSVH